MIAADEAVGIARFLTRPVVAILIVVGCFLLTRITYAVLRSTVRRIADRPPTQAARWWRNSVRRIGAETLEDGQHRRGQRIDAATRMLHHFVSLGLWVVATIAVFHVLRLNAAFFLTSAGFLGAGLAVGGQHRVNDYLTGLAVLLEDRYGVGDEVEAEFGWGRPVRGVVEHIGMVTTRLRDGVSTIHLPHSSLDRVRNLSQEPVTTRLSVPVDASATSVSHAVRDLAGSPGLTTVLFVDDIAAAGEGDRVELNVRTSRPLTESERELLVQRASEVLSKHR
ncbi:MAG: mechanosensitive ion channel family protein [Ilumatobacteraceae bacterium]|mgnify:CR=1 FL=1